MKLSNVRGGHDHVYFCRKNKVICHVQAYYLGDGACLIIETMLPDGEIMGPLLYSEACYLTPINTDAPTEPPTAEQLAELTAELASMTKGMH